MGNYEEVLKKGLGPRVPRSKGSKVQGSQGPKDQDISNSHSNTSLTLKKVHLVWSYFSLQHSREYSVLFSHLKIVVKV